MIRRISAALGLSCLAGPALAHGTLPGGGGFYTGLLHPLYALEHGVALVALGLLLGLADRRAPLLALAAGTAASLSLPWPLPVAPALLLAAAAALAGAALALALRPPPAALAALAALAGLAVGADSEAASAVATAGLMTGIALVTLNAVALARPLAAPARVVVLRVAGSWIAAFAVLLLAEGVTGRGEGA